VSAGILLPPLRRRSTWTPSRARRSRSTRPTATPR